MLNPIFICRNCNGKAWHIDGRTVTDVDVDDTNLDMEATFC